MISVVIPLYNKGPFVDRALKSVQAQTLTDWELIVVDDGSTDNGPVIVESCGDTRVRLVRQANAGVSAARNHGVSLAGSDYVAFLDADDYWAPTHLQHLQEAIEQLPDCVAWASAYYVVPESGQPRLIRLPADQSGRIVELTDYFAQIRSYEPPIHSSAILVKRDVMLALGGFPLGVSVGEDIVMWSRLACAGRLGYVGMGTAFYDAPPISLAVRANFLRRPQLPDPVAAVLRDLMGASPLAPSIKMVLSDWYRNRAMLFLERNERWRACRELILAVREGGLFLRDVVSVLLLSLPHAWRQRAVAYIRQKRRAL